MAQEKTPDSHNNPTQIKQNKATTKMTNTWFQVLRYVTEMQY